MLDSDADSDHFEPNPQHWFQVTSMGSSNAKNGKKVTFCLIHMCLICLIIMNSEKVFKCFSPECILNQNKINVDYL